MTARMIDTNGIRLEVLEQGEGPVVLLLHGFPGERVLLASSVTRLGARGLSRGRAEPARLCRQRPAEAIEAYDIPTLVADAVGVLDAIGAEERAVVVGHDWGAPVAWHMALMHPERVRAVVGMSVPHGGRALSSPLPRMQAIFKDVSSTSCTSRSRAWPKPSSSATSASRCACSITRPRAMRRRAARSPHPKSAKLLDTMRDPSVAGVAERSRSRLTTPSSSSTAASAGRSTGIATSIATGSARRRSRARRSSNPRCSSPASAIRC